MAEDEDLRAELIRRAEELVSSLATSGTLQGGIRIPNTVAVLLAWDLYAGRG